MNLTRNLKLYLLGVPLEPNAVKIIEDTIQRFDNFEISKNGDNTFYIFNNHINIEIDSIKNVWLYRNNLDDLIRTNTTYEDVINYFGILIQKKLKKEFSGIYIEDLKNRIERRVLKKLKKR